MQNTSAEQESLPDDPYQFREEESRVPGKFFPDVPASVEIRIHSHWVYPYQNLFTLDVSGYKRLQNNREEPPAPLKSNQNEPKERHNAVAGARISQSTFNTYTASKAYIMFDAFPLYWLLVPENWDRYSTHDRVRMSHSYKSTNKIRKIKNGNCTRTMRTLILYEFYPYSNWCAIIVCTLIDASAEQSSISFEIT